MRAQQRSDRNSRILQVASELFKSHGYEAVKMEAISSTANLSIGTIYNYYQNKGDLLLAIVALEVHTVLQAGAVLLTQTPNHVAHSIDTLVGTYIDHSLVYLSKEMWRVAMFISTQQPFSPFGLSYSELDIALSEQTCALIQKLQSHGLVKAAIDSQGVGELLFNNFNNMFITYVKSEDMKLEELSRMIRRQNKIVVDAISN